MRLIDADEMTLRFKRMLAPSFIHSTIGSILFSCIAKQPTIDPVKRGHWHQVKEHAYIGGDEAKEWDNFYCSECDAPSDRPYDYCPFCGSRNL